MAWLGLALGLLAPSAPAPSLEIHYNVTNIGGRVPSPWVVQLGQDTADVAACGSLCQLCQPVVLGGIPYRNLWSIFWCLGPGWQELWIFMDYRCWLAGSLLGC